MQHPTIGVVVAEVGERQVASRILDLQCPETRLTKSEDRFEAIPVVKDPLRFTIYGLRRAEQSCVDHAARTGRMGFGRFSELFVRSEQQIVHAKANFGREFVEEWEGPVSIQLSQASCQLDSVGLSVEIDSGAVFEEAT
jgi:hypothetical protein